MSLPVFRQRCTGGATPDLGRLIDHLPGIVFISEATEGWPLKWASAGSLALTGYTAEELTAGDGSAFNRITFHEDRIAVCAAIGDAIEARQEYLLEYRILSKAGELKWVWEKGHGVYDEDGQVVTVEGFITDITPLKLSELSLKESERRLHSIFDNTAEGIFQSSANGAYQKVNAALARIYGFKSPEAMVEELTDIGQQLYADPQRRAQFVALLERRGRVSHFESEVWRKDGVKIWISENARAVRDEDGTLLYYEGTVEDITDRKAAQEALAAERNMLRTVIDAWPDIIYVKDTEGRYALSNRAHTKNLGLTEPSEIVGRKPDDFFVPSRAARLSQEDLELLRTGRAITNREEVRIADGNEQRHFLCAKLPLRDATGAVTGLVSLSRDITDHKQTAEQLRHSQKMEAIGRLAGGIAHDFNNILTAILGYSEMIAHRADRDEYLRRDIEQIHTGAVRASALTQQLLAFSRKQVIQPRLLNLNDIVGDLETMLRRLIGAHIRFETLLDPAVGLIEADPHQLEQVLLNLVINARDAVHDGGFIRIETSQVHLDGMAPNQKLDVLAGPYARLSVSDDGTGIPSSIQHRVFEPFFTTREQGKGTGLGLATCYGIIQQSNGYICLESEEGRGSTFTVFLPIQAQRRAESNDSGEGSRKGDGQEVILVAEDDPAVRELTKTILGELGYFVVTAQDGAEALELLVQGNIPEPAMLLTDVVMPRMGGKALADEVEVRFPETKILFTSGYNEEEVLQRGIATDTIAFISKPFSVDALARKVRQVLDSETVR